MSEYPEDIMKTAKEAWSAIPLLTYASAVDAIAAAILAERERGLKQVLADIDHAKENWAGPVLMKLRRQYAVALDRLKGAEA